VVVVKTISLNLPEELIEASGRHSTALHITRAEYIRQAIERMNRQIDSELRAGRMRQAAAKCSAHDLNVNAEFAAMEADVED